MPFVPLQIIRRFYMTPSHRSRIVVFIAFFAITTIHAAAQLQPVEDLSGLELASVQQRANSGDAAAMFELSNRYQDGANLPVDNKQAFDWAYKAAQKGLPAAQERVGSFYYLGKGITESDSQALVWMRKAAAQGNASAEAFMGVRTEMGQGLPQDYDQAAYWYLKAAAQGYRVAIDNLSSLYSKNKVSQATRSQIEIQLKQLGAPIPEVISHIKTTCETTSRMRTGMRGNPTSKVQQCNPLQNEAQSFADDYWKSRIKHCGDSYFLPLSRSFKNFLNQPTVEETTLEFKNVSFVLKQEELSPAQVLNGYEWNGSESFNFEVYREIHRNQTGTWDLEEWHDAGFGSGIVIPLAIRVLLTKENGKWGFQNIPINIGFRVGFDLWTPFQFPCNLYPKD